MLRFQKLLEVHVLSARQTASCLAGRPPGGGGERLQPPGGGQGWPPQSCAGWVALWAEKPLFREGSGPHLKSCLGPNALSVSLSVQLEGWSRRHFPM